VKRLRICDFQRRVHGFILIFAQFYYQKMNLQKTVFCLFIICLSIFKDSFAQNYETETGIFRDHHIADIFKKFPDQKLDFFEINQNYRIKAHYKLQKKNKVVSFATSDGSYKKYQVFAKIYFDLDGKKIELTTYKIYPAPAMYRKLVFLPIKDMTAPEITYGGGRYLDLNSDDFKDGETTLDFNKLYNPLCVYSDNYSCPVPPKENNLDVRIEAGEKLPLNKQKH
jgi:uncharacterized protein (DUF1684 family)